MIPGLVSRLENVVPVILKKLFPWHESIRRGDFFALIIQNQCELFLAWQLFGDNDGQCFIKRDQAAVKGAVMEGIEAKSILWIEAIVGILCPRDDVTCNQ